MSAVIEGFRPLLDELAAWRAAEKVATLWWRDDDAVAPSAALDHMLALGERYQVPLGLAVIPAEATDALADRLGSTALVDVLQHGFIHRNHAAPGERATEFGPQRPLAVRLDEVTRGWAMLGRFPRRAPIFVPPWNRYEPDIATGLADLGFEAVSAFAASRRLPSPMVECNCHVDIISWRTTRGFAGVGKTVQKLREHLRDRRIGVRPAGEATGVLSHHLVHDEGCWQFLADLFALLEGHPAARWVRPMQAVAAAGAS